MEIFWGLENFKQLENAVVTMGTFDGVHLGHQEIIKDLVQTSKTNQAKSVLITFDPHPRKVLQPDIPLQLIQSVEEKILVLQTTGIDYLIIIPFDKQFSELSSLEFIQKILVEKIGCKKLVIGYDHHFGKNREGNITQLSEYSDVYNFDVEEIPAQDIDEVSVSSTKIRRALESGNLQTANHYLGYPFMLNGTVVNGKKLGGKIGYPTANIAIEEPYKLIPKTGVYVVKSTINENVVFGMMNIGNRPTVDGNYQTIEVHFFDFNEDLYGKKLRIDLLYFLRDEQKFDSISLLVNQLKNDEKNAKNYLKNKL